MNQFFKTHLSYLIRYSLLALFTLIPWVSYSQSVSIGLPIDGAEGSANGSFTVSLDGGGVNTTGNAITGLINYSGSAYYASDFVGAVSFSIPDGIGSVSIPISVLDDHFLELDETVNVSISGLSAGTIGSGTSTLTISDDDLAQLQVSVESLHNRIEGTGHLSFTVFFEGDVENLTGSVITGDISYSGTATNGTDYTSPNTSFSLGFGMSSTNIPAFVTDDVLVESPETVTATISNLSVGTVLNTSSTATILDDDSGDALVSIGFLNHGVEGSSDVSFLV
ncbi:MAG: Calx-beta domain-containing protein, partial [Crocinitomicaceae bacterium]